MLNKKPRIFVAIVLAALGASSMALATELYDAQGHRAKLGLNAFPANDALRGLKIAVLDAGFQGFKADEGLLPSSAELIENYVGRPRGNPLEPVSHGLYMAQIIWAMTGGDAKGPKFYLLNASGMTNLRSAVAFAIEKKVDLVLYSQNWELGGNFDGRGFINQLVNKATSKGILWINAAGNYGGKVHNGPVPASCLRFKNLYDRNKLAVTLSWNDFRETEEYHTSKDFDFEVVNTATQKIVATAARAQIERGDGRERSIHARERVSFQAERGEYCVRVKKIAGDFLDSDRIRLTVMTENKPDDSVEFTDRTDGGEIMVPGDNPTVITVGSTAPQSAKGPTADGRVKPDLILDAAEAKFTDGFISMGTSNAAAFFAGIAAVLKANAPALTREALVAFAQRDVLKEARAGLARMNRLFLLNLKRDANLKIAEMQGALFNPHGPSTLFIKKSPLELGVFDTELANWSASGVSFDELRFFVAHAEDAWGRSYVRTLLVKAWRLGEKPPAFVHEREANGAPRWFELRWKQSSIPGYWATPTPEELP